MRPESPALLWYARNAAALISTFISGRGPSGYRVDPMLRSAVERQFEIIGEALNKLARERLRRAAVGWVSDVPRTG